MGSVTVLPQSRPLTADDLAGVPDDGHRYELVDGTLIVTPAPSTRHQRAVARLLKALLEALSEDLEALAAPYDVRLADDTVLQPDVLVCRRADLTELYLPTAPLLAVEVLSPSTRLVDLSLKHGRYEAAGCPSYWVIDPDEPSLRAWELRDRTYVEVAVAVGNEEFLATLPATVTLVPDDLVR
ncbi:Uma2 family endonuclease [Nocardioides sediminis]|uniref:Uma2 family endonuclease n=1 Tax=Nocardioides sediminis TaxID=433648 RepID=UPI000D324268|nr:Uma2 family endonuclease [Nocardioides sediminis]